MTKTQSYIVYVKAIIFIGIFAFGIIALVLHNVSFEQSFDKIELPAANAEGSVSLFRAFEETSISKKLFSFQLNRKEIAQLCWSLQGITHGPFRTAPSAGGTYPLEVYILQRNTISSLKKGIYHYLPHQHQLELVDTLNNSNIEPMISELPYNIDLTSIDTFFLITAVYNRTTDVYGKNRGVRYVHLEVGHAIQNFLLQSYTLGVSTYPLTNISAVDLGDAFQLQGESQVLLPVGAPTAPSLKYKKLESSQDEKSVENGIANRKSTRDYLKGIFPNNTLYKIIQTVKYIPNLVDLDNESLGTLLDVKLVCGSQVGNSTPGLYQYSFANDSILLVHNQSSTQNELQEAGLNQQWIGNAQFDLVISINTSFSSQTSDPDLYRFVLELEAGMFAQNVYLSCAVLGLGTVVVGAFGDTEVSNIVNLSSDLLPMYIQPVGLTSQFFSQEKQATDKFIDIDRRVLGYVSFILLYLSLFLALPILRLYMTRKIQSLNLHCWCGYGAAIVTLVHFINAHSLFSSVFDLFDLGSVVNFFVFLVRSLLTIPKSRYDIGILASNWAIIFLLIANISTKSKIGIIRKISSYKIASLIHLLSTYIIFILISLHIIYNGNLIISIVNRILLNILIFDFYLILKYLPQFIQTLRQEPTKT